MKREFFMTAASETLSALTVVLVVLKAIGVIEWEWTFVLAPLWIPALFLISSFLILVLFVMARSIVEYAKKVSKWEG